MKINKVGPKVNFKKANLPTTKKLIGNYVILETINPKKHKKDLFESFSIDKKGALWTYMNDGPFKRIEQLDYY